MFDFLKKKKEKDFPEGDLDFPPVAETPINEIIDMRSRGMTNDQIISKLKTEGFNFSQIQNAMSQAEVKSSAVPGPAIPLPEIELPGELKLPEEPELPKPEPVQASGGKDNIERLLEQIIEEKWKGVTNKLDAIENWKAGIDAKMEAIDKGIASLNGRIDKVQTSAASRVDEYDRTMQDVQTEMKALEKIMGKLIPSMTDTIKELREIAEETKRSG